LAGHEDRARRPRELREMPAGTSLGSGHVGRVTTSAEVVTDLDLMTSASGDEIAALERALGHAGDRPLVVKRELVEVKMERDLLKPGGRAGRSGCRATGDLTYIAIEEGWLYLAGVKDCIPAKSSATRWASAWHGT